MAEEVSGVGGWGSVASGVGVGGVGMIAGATGGGIVGKKISEKIEKNE